MTDYELDALLAASLGDTPRPPDHGFVDHNRKRVALKAMIARETQVAIRRGLRDLALAAVLIVMLITWSGHIVDSYGVAAMILPLLVIAFWSVAHDWSLPDLSLGVAERNRADDQPVPRQRHLGDRRPRRGLWASSPS